MFSHRNIRSNQNSDPSEGSLLELTELGAGKQTEGRMCCGVPRKYQVSLVRLRCLVSHQDRLKNE